MHLRYEDYVFAGRVSVNDAAFSINASARVVEALREIRVNLMLGFHWLGLLEIYEE
jgi:hypothetical protein